MGLMFPKPIPRERKGKWRKAKPAKRLSRPGSDPGRLEFCRSLACIGVTCVTGHVCNGPVEASHLRHNTGMSRKEDDRKTVPKCQALHRAWEQHRGPFAGWTNMERFAWMTAFIHEVNLLWDSLSPETRGWWQAQAEIARRRRAESLRGM